MLIFSLTFKMISIKMFLEIRKTSQTSNDGNTGICIFAIFLHHIMYLTSMCSIILMINPL